MVIGRHHHIHYQLPFPISASLSSKVLSSSHQSVFYSVCCASQAKHSHTHAGLPPVVLVFINPLTEVEPFATYSYLIIITIMINPYIMNHYRQQSQHNDPLQRALHCRPSILSTCTICHVMNIAARLMLKMMIMIVSIIIIYIMRNMMFKHHS